MKAIAFYQNFFDLKNSTFLLIGHEDALVATVYKIIHSNLEFILKICKRPNDYLCEIYATFL